MAISTEITRISNDRDRIRAKLVSLGLAESTDRLDALAAAVEEIADNGAVSATIDGINSTSASIPAGFTSGGTVTLTDAIENALKAI